MHLAESTASVLMDRALGVLSVVLVAAAALPFATAAGRARELIMILAAMFGRVCSRGGGGLQRAGGGPVRGAARG